MAVVIICTCKQLAWVRMLVPCRLYQFRATFLSSICLSCPFSLIGFCFPFLFTLLILLHFCDEVSIGRGFFIALHFDAMLAQFLDCLSLSSLLVSLLQALHVLGRSVFGILWALFFLLLVRVLFLFHIGRSDRIPHELAP